MSDPERQDLLHLLESRGRDFLSLFGPSFVPVDQDASSTRAGKRRRIEEQSADEEWAGITYSADDHFAIESASEAESSEAEHGQQPKVVVFSEQQVTASSSSSGGMSKAQMKAFMSSKVAKLREDVQDEDEGGDSESDDDDLTNAQNDALLHRLVHTRLLSGSLNPELELTPAQRKKALAGRILEASGKAKLGKGERAVRSAERNKAAKRIREGLADKQEERRQKELEEAKHLGNYHPALKKLYDAEEKRTNRKREKGLAMGIGSYKGGVLRLGQEDLSSLRQSTGGGRRGRGGRGGGPRKRGGRK